MNDNNIMNHSAAVMLGEVHAKSNLILSEIKEIRKVAETQGERIRSLENSRSRMNGVAAAIGGVSAAVATIVTKLIGVI